MHKGVAFDKSPSTTKHSLRRWRENSQCFQNSKNFRLIKIFNTNTLEKYNLNIPLPTVQNRANTCGPEFPLPLLYWLLAKSHSW